MRTFILRLILIGFALLFLRIFLIAKPNSLGETRSPASLVHGLDQERTPPFDCIYTLSMFDSGGDGWNGSFVTICVAGDCVNYTIYESDTTVDIGAMAGQLLIVSYTPMGGEDSQHSYSLTQFGVPVYTSASPPASGLVYSAVVTCDPPPAPSSDCLGAMSLCDNSPVLASPLVPFGYVDDLNENNQGCLENGENMGRWFLFHISQFSEPGAAMGFHIVPGWLVGVPTDSTIFDFALWGPYYGWGFGPPGSMYWNGLAGNCSPNEPPLRCSYASNYNITGTSFDDDLPLTEGSNGTGYIRYFTTEPGQVYLLYVDDRLAVPAQFQIHWTTPPPGFGPMAEIGCEGFPTEILANSTSTWSLYPNPNTGQFAITSEVDAFNVELQVIDLSGRIVHQGQTHFDQQQPQVLDLPEEITSGTYYLRLNDGQKSHVEQLVLIRP